ncbi:hypothetical protein HPB48_002574 [Haemaphysalis longicornis]|uniref:Uncharacterized protein n=1 Tax=Haemaphysalis longicornis TaxID=44386 RepID=A0A9J6FC64_HAELO|nr:hypothetical protein HPB48_002574 [Haemaphysalis longicornis]
MVLPNVVFYAKASEALSSTFDLRTDIALDKVKARAKKLCAKLNLDALAKKAEKSSGCALKMFFSAKTHKVARPLRVIISGRGTWQKTVVTFLLERLNFWKLMTPLWFVVLLM